MLINVDGADTMPAVPVGTGDTMGRVNLMREATAGVAPPPPPLRGRAGSARTAGWSVSE